jgi:hypothetical protein
MIFSEMMMQSQITSRNSHRLRTNDRDAKVLESDKNLSKSSAGKTGKEVLGDLKTWTLVEFCDLVHLAKDLPEYQNPGEIMADIECGGAAARILDRMRQEGFGAIVEEAIEFGDSEQGKEVARMFNGATLFAILQLCRVLKDWPEKPGREEIVVESKRRKKTREQRRHVHFRLAIPMDKKILVPILMLFPDAKAFTAGRDGRLEPNRIAMPGYGCTELIRRFYDVLDGAYLTRFRRCAYRKCQRLFYAGRDDQLCCTPRCNNARWQLEWYAKHGKSAKE